jgi:hypothetical protein
MQETELSKKDCLVEQGIVKCGFCSCADRQILVADVCGGWGKQVIIKNVYSEIFLNLSLLFMVSVVCSFLAVEGTCQPHL